MTFQFPIIDKRAFIKDDAKKYFYPPGWIADNKYLKSFGNSLDDNPDGPAVREKAYMKAARAVRFPTMSNLYIQPYNGCTFSLRGTAKYKTRQFYTDSAISNFNIEIECRAGKNQTAFDGDKVSLFLGAIFQIPVKIPTGQMFRSASGEPERTFTNTVLQNAGRPIASLYYGATLKDKAQLPTAREQELVGSGTPLVILQYDEEEMKNITDSFEHINCDKGFCVHYAPIRVDSRRCDVWLVKNDNDWAAINRLCNCLSYLHHEKEGVLEILKWLNNMYGDYELLERKIVWFLKDKAKQLTKPRTFGYDKQNLLDIAYKYDLQVNKEKFAFILSKIEANREIFGDDINTIRELFENKRDTPIEPKTMINYSIEEVILMIGDNGMIEINKAGRDIINAGRDIITVGGDVKNSFNTGVTECIGKTENEELKKELENLRQEVDKVANIFDGTKEQKAELEELMQDIRNFCDQAVSDNPVKNILQKAVAGAEFVAKTIATVNSSSIVSMMTRIIGIIFNQTPAAG